MLVMHPPREVIEKFAAENPKFSFCILLAFAFLMGFVTCLFTVK